MTFEEIAEAMIAQCGGDMRAAVYRLAAEVAALRASVSPGYARLKCLEEKR